MIALWIKIIYLSLTYFPLSLHPFRTSYRLCLCLLWVSSAQSTQTHMRLHWTALLNIKSLRGKPLLLGIHIVVMKCTNSDNNNTAGSSFGLNLHYGITLTGFEVYLRFSWKRFKSYVSCMYACFIIMTHDLHNLSKFCIWEELSLHLCKYRYSTVQCIHFIGLFRPPQTNVFDQCNLVFW